MTIQSLFKSFNSSDAVSYWRHLTYYACTLFFIILVIPMLHHNMFFDGIIYATLAKNLTQHYGTIWRPIFTETMLNPFYEHPPLAIYFQSLFFKVLGPGFGAEQLYTIVMALGQFGLIAWYWLRNHKVPLFSLGLLLILWLMTPLNWLYIRNYLIATLTLFTTFASLILLLKTRSKMGFITQYSLAAISILLGFFSDGPNALFPLMIPILVHLILDPKTRYQGFWKTGVLVLLLTLGFLIFFTLFPEALINIQQFFKQQVFASILGTRDHLSLNTQGIRHLYVLFLLIKAYIGVAIFVLVCIVISAKITQQPILDFVLKTLVDKQFLLFFSLALLSSLPIAISGRQTLHYLLPSAPFFTLAMMSICFQPFNTIVTYCAQKPIFKYQYFANHLFFIILILSIGISNILNYRHSNVSKLMHDIHYLNQYCDQHSLCRNHGILSVSDNKVIWEISFYLARYSQHKMSITPEAGFPYYLGFSNAPLPEGYQQVKLPLALFKFAKLDTKMTQFKTHIQHPIQTL